MQRHWKRLFRIAYGILRNAADAEDASQEAWMNAWRRLGSWRGDAPVGAWLSRVAANAAIDRLRRRRDDLRVPEPVEMHEEHLAASGPAPEDVAEDRLFAADLDRARAVLSPQQRAVFEMKAVAGREFAEIAATLGCGESSARQHFFRAIRKLRGELEQWR